MTTTQAASGKAAALLATPGAITLHHGHGVARVYTVIGRTGTYTTTENTCDCAAGFNGRDCYHCEAIRALHAAELTSAPAPITDVWALLPAVDDFEDAPVDEALTVDEAAGRLGIKPVTIRRYLAAGKLARAGGGISAASVDAYAASRAANITRTRFKAIPPVVVPAKAFYAPEEMPAVEEIETAARLYDQGAEASRTGERAKRKAKKTLDRLPAGQYGPAGIDWEESSRLTPDLEAIERIFKAHRLGAVPMRPCAPTLRVTIAAAPTAELRIAA